ncbi:hypothetical protein EDC96DRAFT_508903 [Choanephora cucurbitarum]|nr:hypothetical protein EDC96DRAFT_508903 [Choanephora cucurbitarum]
MLIVDVLKPYFKSLNNSKLHLLAKAIACVACGLRVSHLIDVAAIDQHKAKQLLLALKKLPQCRTIALLQFKDRFSFICHSELLDQHVKSTLQNPDQLAFIAVEGKEPQPTEMPTCLTTWIRDKLCLSNAIYYSPIVPTFMVALTGWLLEYPIIYTTHLSTDDPEGELDEWEVRTNCLGNQPLQLTKVYLSHPDDIHLLMSFSSLAIQTTSYIGPFELKLKQRLVDAQKKFHWLRGYHINIAFEQIKLDRFAL